MNLLLLAANNVRRNKLRTALTMSGVAVSMLAFVFFRTLIWAYDVQLNETADDRIWTFDRTSPFIPLPRRYADEVRARKEVRCATWGRIFHFDDPHRDDPVTVFAIDEKEYFNVFDDMVTPPEALKAFKEDRIGAIVGRPLLLRHGWKVGDTIKLTTKSADLPGEWEFHIYGVYDVLRKSIWPDDLMIHWDLLNDRIVQARRDQVGWIVSRTAKGIAGPDACAAIDRVFDTADRQTRTESDRAWNASFMGTVSAVLKVIDLVTVVVLGVMMLVLGNTVAMGLRERIGELAVLRALGFRPHHVATLVLGEAATLGLAGAALGVALAYPMIDFVMGPFIVRRYGDFFPFFSLQLRTVVSALLVGTALGVAAGSVSAVRALRIRIVDALRSTG